MNLMRAINAQYYTISTHIQSTHLPSNKTYFTHCKLVDLEEKGAENEASADVNEMPKSDSLIAKLSLLPSPLFIYF